VHRQERKTGKKTQVTEPINIVSIQGRVSVKPAPVFFKTPFMKEETKKPDIQVKASRDLSPDEYSEILTLCTQAYRRDYLPYLKMFKDPVHVLGRYRGKLVSHVLWITRWLQIGTNPVLRTAYIEAVATDPEYRRRGFASELMRRAAGEIKDFDIGGLSTGSKDFYTRLGWQLWQGQLFLRTDKGLVPTPDEHGVMVLPLSKTPPLNLYAQLSIEWREIEPW
jgi:aminoglycoside 2'-N-acetyltransferase I